MKRILLTIAATGLCLTAGQAADYGTTPETAVPMPSMGWMVTSLDDAPEAAYFTYENTNAAPVMWGDTPGGDTYKQVFVYLCDGGQEAFQMAEGSNSYILLPGEKYLVKITPKEVGSYCMMSMMSPTAVPASMEGTRKFYPKVLESISGTQTIEKGKTAWFQLVVPYPTQLALKDNSFLPVSDEQVPSVEAIHIECPGGTNKGTGLVGPYLKAGKNVIGITVSENIEDDNLSILFGYNATMTLNCGNHLLRGASMQLGEESTYPDAYYTVDRFFTVPEDGSYTFTNHGAEGTILNIGTVKVADPENNPYNGECDWADIKSATVGTEDAVITVADLKKGAIVAVQSDAFGIIGAGMENQPYLKVEKALPEGSGVSGIEAEANGMKAVAAAGKLSVESALLASGAEVAVYDMVANKVAAAKAASGAASLEMPLDVAPGVYVVVVYGKGNSESAKIVVK